MFRNIKKKTNRNNLLNIVRLDFHKLNKTQSVASKRRQCPRTNAQKIKPPTL